MNYNNLKGKKHIAYNPVELGERLKKHNIGRMSCMLLL